MTFTNRITVDEVRQAVKRTHFELVEKDFGSACSGCAISALFVDEFARLGMIIPTMNSFPMAARMWAIGRYGDDYTNGFVSGFDGKVAKNEELWLKTMSDREVEGFKDGRACRVLLESQS